VSGPEARSWKRNQWVTTAMVFVVFLGFAFVIPFLPLYVRELGVSDAEEATLWAGVLIGIAPLLAGLLAPVWGRLAERYGHKPMAIRALVASIVFLALSAYVRSVPELLVCRIATGLFGGIGPLGLAMATTLAPREETGKAVGLIQAAQILSAAIGPFAGGLVSDHVGRRPTFLLTALLCAFALALVVLFYEEAPRERAPDAPPAPKLSLLDVARLPGVRPLLVALFLVNFVGRAITPILPAHLERLGVAPSLLGSYSGLLISAYAVMAAVSATLLGRASRRRSPRGLLVASLLAGTATVLPMAAAPSFPVFLGLAVLLGLASGGALTLCYTIGGLLVPAEHRTTAFGFFSGAALFGGALSPSVAGALAHIHLLAIYPVNAALFLGLGLALWPGARREARAGQAAV
jgi:DHA1 family multidrug resistance protein-like MFS transporter